MFEPPTLIFNPPVHRIHVRHVLWRPEPLRNRRSSRPDPRINIFTSHVFRPHARLASENEALLLGIEGSCVAAEWIVCIMLRGGPHVIKVVAERKNAPEAKLRRFSERFLPAPRLDDDVLRQLGSKNFIPPDHDLSMLADDFLDTRIEVSLECVIIL